MAEPTTLLLVALIGLAGGLVGGLFGVGGGIVMVPLLLLAVPGTGFKEAKAAALFVMVLAAFVAVLAHRRKRSVDARRGLLLGLGGVVGAVVAAYVAELLTERTLTLAFAALLAVVGVRLLLRYTPRPHDVRPSVGAPATVAVGFVAGLLAGFFGIGGGVLMVPALVFLGHGMHLAVGTSLVAVWVNSVAATGAHLALGYLPTLVLLGLPLALGAVPGGELGARLAHRLPAARLQRGFGLFLLVAAAYLAYAA